MKQIKKITITLNDEESISFDLNPEDKFFINHGRRVFYDEVNFGELDTPTRIKMREDENAYVIAFGDRKILESLINEVRQKVVYDKDNGITFNANY